MWGVDGNGHELGDAGAGSGKSFLFFLTVEGPWKQFNWREGLPTGRAAHFVLSGAPVTVRENPGEGIAFAAGRTDNRSRSSR